MEKNKKWIIANWKMHKVREEAEDFFAALSKDKVPQEVAVGIAPPFTLLPFLIPSCQERGWYVGAQNVAEATEGPFTGEISAKMLKDLYVSFCLVGHSERRMLFHEMNSQIAQKIKQLSKLGIVPILCVGETAEEREQNRVKEVLGNQIKECLQDMEPCAIMIAYEPVWAIGSGIVPEVKEIDAILFFIRDKIGDVWGKGVAQETILLYGGSVNSTTISAFLHSTLIQGYLVGGSSLEAESFSAILEKVKEVK